MQHPQSVFLRQQDRGGGTVALVILGFGNDPELRALGRAVGREQTGTVLERLVVEGLVLGRDIAPVTSGMAA